MCRFFFIILQILFAGAFEVTAQQLFFRNISQQLDLPSGECYSLIQDQSGYLWIATDAGLCKYNGSSLKVFSGQEGLAEGGIYYMKCLPDTSLLMISSRNRILRMKRDIIREDPASRAVKDKFQENYDIGYQLNRRTGSELILNSYSWSMRIEQGAGDISVSKIPAASPDSVNLLLDLTFLEPGLIKREPIRQTAGNKFYQVRLQIHTRKRDTVISMLFNNLEALDSRIKTCSRYGYTFLNIQDRLIKVDNDLRCEIIQLPGKISAVHVDSSGGLWIGMFNGGLRHYKSFLSATAPDSALSNLTVTGIQVDHEGSVWCSTLEKGVFFCGDKRITYYPGKPILGKSATLLKALNNAVVISASGDHFLLLDKSGISEKRENGGNAEFTDVMFFNDRYYFATKGFLFSTDRRFNRTANICDQDGRRKCTFELDTVAGKLYGLGSASELMSIRGDRFVGYHFSAMGQARTFRMLSDSTFLAGSADGLFLVNFVTGTSKRLLGSTVSLIRRISDGLLVCTAGAGLYLYDKNGLHVFFGGSFLGYRINDICEDRDGTLWMASGRGLIRVIRDGRIRRTEVYTTAHSLPSNNIQYVTLEGGCLYASTPEGVFRMWTPGLSPNEQPPRVYLRSVETNKGRISDARSFLNFNHDENTLVATMEAITYRGPGSLFYRLYGRDTGFLAVNPPDIRLENLSPGTYTLSVFAVNADGVKSKVPSALIFIIRPPLWAEPWMIVSLLSFFLVVVFLCLRLLVRNARKKESERNRLDTLVAESQLAALQARMNPHFTFNAINSIQNYILKKNEDEAYHYLARFGKLIRKVLNNSRKSSVSLHEELETIRLYVELEQLRFRNSFEFFNEISDQINAHEVQIPAMVIQPYVENAIVHGLMHLDPGKKGVIRLKAELGEGALKITIEDNGVGRTRSKKYQNGRVHAPLAMKLTEKRLHIISRLKDYRGTTCKVTDLEANDGGPLGTKVEIYLPLRDYECNHQDDNHRR